MPRQPQLRKKVVGDSVYWFTKVGGETYFGCVARGKIVRTKIRGGAIRIKPPAGVSNLPTGDRNTW